MKYSEESLIKLSQINDKGKIKTGPLIDIIQDVEGNGVEKLETFYNYNKNNNIGIFINYREITIMSRPQYRDLIEIITHPFMTNQFYGLRETVVYNNHKPVLVVNTLGTFVDLNNSRPTRLPREVVGSITTNDQIIPLKINRKIKVPTNDFDYELKIPIFNTFIDYYSHVNNAYYIVFSESVLPVDFKYNQIRTEYRKALILGQTAVVRRYKINDGYCIIITSTDELDEIYTIVEFNNIIGGFNNEK